MKLILVVKLYQRDWINNNISLETSKYRVYNMYDPD